MTSEIYELVASDDVLFFVHKDILVSRSKPFQEAIAGPWKEALERRIHLTDWDSDTVARLVEFLYVDNYSYPDPSPIKTEQSPTETDPESVPSAAENEESPPESGRPLTPFAECMQRSLPPCPTDAVTDGQRLERFNSAEYDFGEVLLGHAKVYALANYKGIEELRALALRRLFLALARVHPLQPASHISINIVDFASYVYANTDPLSHTEEPLRKMTSQFIALNLVAFQTEPRAVEFIAQGGDVVRDLMSKICRILPSQSAVVSWTGGLPHTRYISNLKVRILSSYKLPELIL